MPPAANVASISVELDFGPIVHMIFVRLVLRKPAAKRTSVHHDIVYDTTGSHLTKVLIAIVTASACGKYRFRSVPWQAQSQPPCLPLVRLTRW